MRRRSKEKQQGVALIMVLIALTILGAMTADLMETNEVYLATAVNARDALKAEYMAKSGINLSRLTLSFREILGDTALPFWQYADMLVSSFTGSGGGFLGDITGSNLADVEGLGLEGIGPDDDLKVTIVDEESKINVNVSNIVVQGNGSARMLFELESLMSPPEFDELFDDELGSGELSTREEIICEIIDFSDGNEDLCDLSGTEDSSLYTTLEPAYYRKNAPLDSLQELHLVSGIDDDLYSAFVDPRPEDPDRRIMTVWGKGRINVNTAPLDVLLALACDLAREPNGIGACEDPLQRIQMAAILQGIVMIRSWMPLARITDFTKAIENPETIFLIGMPGIPLSQTKRPAWRNMMTTRSSIFSIYAEATVGRVTKRIHMVVDMNSDVTLALPDEETINAAGGKVLYYRMD